MATVTQLGKATVFTVGGTDFNDQLRSITMTKTLPALDATTLASTYVENVAGLENSETTFTLLGSFATAEAIQFAFGDVGTTSVIVYEPLAAAPGASSPRYTHTGGYLAQAPIVVNVGELVEITCTYSGGEITQAVA
ncbi:MAG: hypothetical protein ACO3S3_12060 [Pseudohongiellaceae bacterium]|jgi:hypothetical protein